MIPDMLPSEMESEMIINWNADNESGNEEIILSDSSSGFTDLEISEDKEEESEPEIKTEHVEITDLLLERMIEEWIFANRMIKRLNYYNRKCRSTSLKGFKKDHELYKSLFEKFFRRRERRLAKVYRYANCLVELNAFEEVKDAITWLEKHFD